MGKYDFQQLKKDCDLINIVERYGDLSLKQEPGSIHWKGKCPFHNEDSASFTVTPAKNYITCFGCGWKGDVFDFLKELNYPLDEQISIIKGEVIGSNTSMPERRNIQRDAPQWKQSTPDRWPTKFLHERYGEPVAVWPYHNSDGIIISYDCRFEWFDTVAQKVRKDVLPMTFMTDGVRSEWRWHGMDIKRLLSNLHILHQDADKARAVLIVEGRKTAAAAERLIKKPIVTTWQGGSNAIQQTDWSPLFGRDIIIWQDNDYPGYKAACEIRDILKPHCSNIMFVHNPPGAEKGWDAADALAAGWDADTTRKFILMYKPEPQVIINPKDNENITQSTGSLAPEPSRSADNGISGSNEQSTEFPEPPFAQFEYLDPLPGEDVQMQATPPNNKVEQNDFTPGRNKYFIFLGFESKDGKISHCFYSLRNKVIIKLTASSIGKAAPLLELAPLEYWECEFPGQKGGINLPAAANFLISISGQLPIFRGANIRGRGVWVDAGSVIVHNGDHLIVDGKNTGLGGLNSKHIYEQNQSFGINPSNPLHNKEASKLLDLCNELRWDRAVNGYLLAGWCVIAPVCGALSWRPHIWVTGGSGSGKTWVLVNIVKPLLGDTALRVQGSTSEAGIRQSLYRDARPVVFDEAEGESIKDSERMQTVLTLARSASSEDGGNIVKGSSASGAESYQIRSCFAWASIGMQISQQSDRTRISVLGLRSDGESEVEKKLAREHFAEIEKRHFYLMTPEYVQRLQARTISLLPVILKNTKTFSVATARVLGQQRTGDQLGALLAGAYSLRYDTEINLQQAEDWVRNKDWSEEAAISETRDEHNVFAHIMEQIVRVEGATNSWDRTIGELIRISMGFDSESEQNNITTHAAKNRLNRSGIRTSIDDGKAFIIISNSDYAIKRMLSNTPWSKNHANLLIRIPGAEKRENLKFGSGVSSRAVAIPMNYFVQ